MNDQRNTGNKQDIAVCQKTPLPQEHLDGAQEGLLVAAGGFLDLLCTLRRNRRFLAVPRS